MNRDKKLTRAIVVRLGPELDDWLQDVSDEEGRTKSQTVRWMLQAVMNKGMPQ